MGPGQNGTLVGVPGGKQAVPGQCRGAACCAPAAGSDRHLGTALVVTEAPPEARVDLRAGYQEISEEQVTRRGTVGGWPVKDAPSHVTSCEEVMLPDTASDA